MPFIPVNDKNPPEKQTAIDEFLASLTKKFRSLSDNDFDKFASSLEELIHTSLYSANDNPEINKILHDLNEAVFSTYKKSLSELSDEEFGELLVKIAQTSLDGKSISPGEMEEYTSEFSKNILATLQNEKKDWEKKLATARANKSLNLVNQFEQNIQNIDLEIKDIETYLEKLKTAFGLPSIEPTHKLDFASSTLTIYSANSSTIWKFVDMPVGISLPSKDKILDQCVSIKPGTSLVFSKPFLQLYDGIKELSIRVKKPDLLTKDKLLSIHRKLIDISSPFCDGIAQNSDFEKDLKFFEENYQSVRNLDADQAIKVLLQKRHKILFNKTYIEDETLDIENMSEEDLQEAPETQKEFYDTMTNLDGWITENDGTQKHYVEGKLHNDNNSPAKIRANGTKEYFKNGKRHRIGGPAFEGYNGSAKFFHNGEKHRAGGEPAVLVPKGQYRQQWWQNNQIQKASDKFGTTYWFAPGCRSIDNVKLHREDGPAKVYTNGKEEFWLHGVQYASRADYENALRLLHDAPKPKVNRSVTQQQASYLKKEQKMSKPSFAEMMKTNALDAGYRVGATQINKVVKTGILTVMRNKGANDGAISGFQTFMESEYGEAMLSLMIGAALNYAPTSMGQDPRVQRLAEEMRVGGMANLGNAFLGEAVEHLLPAVSEIIQKLPALEQEEKQTVRVEEKAKHIAEAMDTEEEDEDEEEETSTEVKTRATRS